jgi:tetratricopeptide (TPR) repeat protein
MDFNQAESYMRSPLFNEAMEYFRRGKWDEGFSKFDEVQKEYPTEPELRAIRQEMEVRARISNYEHDEIRRNRIRKVSVYGVRTVVVVGILAVLFLAVSTYYGWIKGQVENAQLEFSKSMMLAELTIEFRNAQQLMTAGKSDEALQKYASIQEKNPDFPGLSQAITDAQNLKDVETQYTQAMNLLQTGDSAQALAMLTEINQKMPNYRDVSLQVKNLQTESQMSSVLQQADQAYLEGRYEDALSGYESLRLMDPSYQAAHIENNLFYSYVNAAQGMLSEPVPSMDTLRKIDDYFSKALALRPQDRDALAARTQVRLSIEDGLIGDYLNQAAAALTVAPDSMEAQKKAEQFLAMALAVRPNDPDIMTSYKVAQSFIQAVSDFSRSNWDGVIEQLEYVMANNPSYGDGTATQTLYDAYIARGSDYVASGEYALALADFQRAAVLAQQLENSESQSFEAQISIAEAQGLLNHFEDAVHIYQDALITVGLHERIAGLHNSLSDTLTYADYLATLGNYQSAFYAYRKLVQSRVNAYNQDTVVTVKSGDYLSMLAHRYNTTVAAILAANGMSNQPRISPDTKLIIPTLP